MDTSLTKTSRGRGVTHKMCRFFRLHKNNPFKVVKIIIKFCNNQVFSLFVAASSHLEVANAFHGLQTLPVYQFIGIYEKLVFSSVHGRRYQSFDSFHKVLFY